MAILYPGTPRVHSYTVLYTVKFIDRSAVILEVDRPFGGRSGAIAVSLALSRNPPPAEKYRLQVNRMVDRRGTFSVKYPGGQT